ncbi:MAG: glycosyltransferase family 39 protein [Anaerolineales bacterium]
MNFSRRDWGPLALLLAARLALGLTYSLSVPPWESYDETGHFQYARYLAKYRQLLQPSDPEADSIWSKFQPPLYYILIAPVLTGFDRGEKFQFPELNPLLSYGNAGVNYAITLDAPVGLERTQVEALRLARSVGVVISTLSTVFVFLAARRLWPKHRARVWTATVLYAFWPQFLFMGSMVTNDLLVTSLAAPILYFTVCVLQDNAHYRLLAVTTLLVLAGILTKLNALAFVPVAVAALVLNFWLGHRTKTLWTLLGVATVTCVGIYALSSLTFVTDQVFQWATLTRLLANLQVSTYPLSWSTWEYAAKTFFASYGWGNLESYPWVYPIWYLAAATAVMGLLRLTPAWWRNDRRMLVVWSILALQPISLVSLTVALAIAQQDSNLVVGRYLLPALPAVALLLVEGWCGLIAFRWQRFVLTGLTLAVIGLGWLMPFTIIADAYAKPQPLTEAKAAAMIRDVQTVYGDAIEFLGYLPSQAAVSGGRVRVDLCWQARAPILENYFVQLEIIGPDGQGYGRLVSYPRDGNYPTRLWSPGQPFCDWFELIVPEAFPAPAASVVEINLLRTPTGDPLPLTDPQGATHSHGARMPLIIRAAQPPPQPEQATAYRFGEDIQLNGYDVSLWPDRRGVTVTLYWQTSARLSESYKVFAHLRTVDPQVFTQSDGAPRSNAYPTTAWGEGEIVADTHQLSLPSGADYEAVSLYVGLYHPSDGMRLLVSNATGDSIPNGEVKLSLVR